MKMKTPVGLAGKCAVVVTLSAFAFAAEASPFTLQGVCRLTSIIAGQGQCQLEYIAADAFISPTVLRLGSISVDGIVVAQYVNDITNPAAASTGSVSGAVAVSCGTYHTVRAYIAPSPSVVYEQIGALPPIKCPAAP